MDRLSNVMETKKTNEILKRKVKIYNTLSFDYSRFPERARKKRRSKTAAERESHKP